MSGTVDVEVAAFALTVLQRDDPKYWVSRPLDGSVHGASWRTLNWVARPIEGRTLRLHTSDRLVLPAARANFRELLSYLGDLGCTTNPDGFWELQQYGLNVVPGTCLVEQVTRGRGAVPILVVATPTTGHTGNLLLRFQNQPSGSRRGLRDLEPTFVRLQSTRYPNLCHSDSKEQYDSERKRDYNLKMNRKGIIEMRPEGCNPVPVYGLSFWFTYCLLASSIQDGPPIYNGRPAGFKMRLGTFYFARECVYPILDPGFHEKWSLMFLANSNAVKMATIPAPWTEDSASRVDLRLSGRFQHLLTDALRKRSANFRKARAHAMEQVRIIKELGLGRFRATAGDVETIYMPLEAFDINPEFWSDTSSLATPELLSPLDSRYPPTSGEICIAACVNERLGQRIASVLLELFSWFKGKGELSSLAVEPTDDDLVVYMCAMVVLGAIADKAGYLASLCDIEECASAWQLVYLS